MPNEVKQENVDCEAADSAVKLLGEHFDNVQILCSRYEDGATTRMIIGKGDVFARQGLAIHFLNNPVQFNPREREEG